MIKRAALFLLLGTAPLAAYAASDDVETRQQTLQRATQEAADKANRLKEEAEAASSDLSTLQERLVNASTRERELSERLSSLIERTRELERQQTDLTSQLGTKRQHLAELLTGLARLSRLPPEIGLLREGNTKDAINTALLLESSLPQLQLEARALSSSLTQLDTVQKQLEGERANLAEARAAQDKEQAQIEVMIKARQKKLSLTTRQQADMQARLAKLKDESANLEDLIRKVAAPNPAAGGKPDEPAPVMALRGGFLQPVNGRVTRQYGQADEVGNKSLGLTFAALPGARIVSPARGKVMFAGPFKGYGLIVIVEHGDDMHSLIAGFGRLDVAIGQKVSQGEPLGLTAGPGGAQPVAEKRDDTGSEKPQDVYFELRREGEPIDPRVRQR